MATAPASVGVQIPSRILPMIMIGRHNGNTAGLNAAQSSCPDARFSLRRGIPRFLDYLDTMNIIAAQRITAGTIPATNSLPIEVPVTLP